MLTTQSARPLWKRWLVLGTVVLLVHLGLLRSMPTAIQPAEPAATSVLRFATRAIDPPRAPAPLTPNPVVQARPKKVHPPPPPKPAVVAPPVPAPADVVSTNDSPNVDTFGTQPQHSADEAAALPATPASAPELAQTTPTEAPPDQDALAPRPPRDKPLNFNAESLSASRRLIYTLKTNKFPFTLNAELLWRNQGDSYSARLRYSAFGIARVQTSQGRITTTGLAPERFSDKYRSEVAAHFNYEQHKVTFSANTPDAPLLTGAQDRLSVLIQLGALVASEPSRYEQGSTITVQTVGARSADLWLFTVIQTETLQLPGGSVQSLKLERNPREPYDQKVELWLAPDLGYLPVRIRITDANGDSADQQWSATESADAAD